MTRHYKEASIDTAGSRTVQGMITTEHVDSDREVVVADGVTFRSHVPLLAGHNSGDPAQCIGKLRRTPTRRDNGWFAAFMVHERHEDLWEKARDGLLQFSIGFDILEQGPPTPEERAKWPGVQNVIRKCLVVETSLVSVPANEHALVEQAKAYRLTAKHLEWLTGKPAAQLITIEPARRIQLVDAPTNIVIE